MPYNGHTTEPWSLKKKIADRKLWYWYIICEFLCAKAIECIRPVIATRNQHYTGDIFTMNSFRSVSNRKRMNEKNNKCVYRLVKQLDVNLTETIVFISMLAFFFSFANILNSNFRFNWKFWFAYTFIPHFSVLV